MVHGTLASIPKVLNSALYDTEVKKVSKISDAKIAKFSAYFSIIDLFKITMKYLVENNSKTKNVNVE